MSSVGGTNQADGKGKKPVKSLLISSTDFPPESGGISRMMSAIATNLGAGEVCCLTAVPCESQDHTAPECVTGPRIYRRPASFARRTHVQTVGFAVAITEILVRERPRAVQVATAYDGYMGLWLERWLKLPFVVYAHGNELFHVADHRWSKPRISLQRAARVLANSHFTGRLAVEAGADPQRVEVVHPGCDTDQFQPRVPENELRLKLFQAQMPDRVILSVGRLVARKGHDMVVRALPRLLPSTPNLSYLVVGDGPYRSTLEDLAAAAGVRGHVIFAGQLPDEFLPEVYALADVFAMPSREMPEAREVEGFGLVFLEANACGKPVVAGRSGGIPDAVVDGVTGFLVNPNDPEDVARGLGQILVSKELARRMGEQGRARVVREFTWQQFAGRLRQILASIVEGDARGHG